MRLRPFFKRYGAKHRLASKYPPPKYDVVIETHAGSAQYATLHNTRQIVLCERDPDIAALWQWLLHAEPGDVAALPCEDLIPGQDIRELDIPYPAQLLIRSWQRVGRSTCWTVSKWNNANSGLWHPDTRDMIAQQLDSIRHWIVVEGDFASIPWSDIFPRPVTYFIDPPYQSQPTIYGGAAPDFDALAEFAKTRLGQVIVCEAPGADWLPFHPLAENTVGRTHLGGTRARRTEMVWSND